MEAIMIEQDVDGTPIFRSLNGGLRAASPYISPELIIVEPVPDPPNQDFAEPAITNDSKEGA